MPTVLRSGPYRFFFFSSDRDEPEHVHVERDDATAKFWLDPIRLQLSNGYSAKELNGIQSIILEHQQELLEAWNEFFNS